MISHIKPRFVAFSVHLLTLASSDDLSLLKSISDAFYIYETWSKRVVLVRNSFEYRDHSWREATEEDQGRITE